MALFSSRHILSNFVTWFSVQLVFGDSKTRFKRPKPYTQKLCTNQSERTVPQQYFSCMSCRSWQICIILVFAHQYCTSNKCVYCMLCHQFGMVWLVEIICMYHLNDIDCLYCWLKDALEWKKLWVTRRQSWIISISLFVSLGWWQILVRIRVL